jgi:hypothetical protein
MPLAVLAVWVLLYGPRPFRIGFYHDDWWSLVEITHGTAPFGPERFKLFMGPTVDAGRPVDGFLMFLVSSIAGTSPITYQLVAASFVLLAALSLRAWFVSLMPGHDFPSRNFAADFATIFWLSIPWSIASTGWPVLAPAAMGSQILFTEASRRILPPRQLTAKVLSISAFALVASYLTYEAFYFQFLVVAGFYLIFERENFRTTFSSAGLIIVALSSQLLAIVFNRFMSLLNSTPARKLSANWPNLFVVNLRGLPHQLTYSLGALGKLWVGIFSVCLVVTLVTLLRGLFDRQLFRPTKRLFGILLMGTTAVPATVVTYSLAGYGISAGGVNARTLQGVSCAIAMIFFSVVSMLLLPRAKLVKAILMAGLLSIVILNCIAQERQLEDWAFVWRQEKEVLAHAPIEKLKTLPPDSRVLYIGPSYYHDMVIFGADWDITGAVFSLPPLSQGRRHHKGLTQIHSAAIYNWRWDGKNLIQEEPGFWTLTYPAARLFVWNYDRGELIEATAGYRLGREEIKAYVK